MNAPDWFEKELRNIGGSNPYGEPNLRIVWSPNERREHGHFKGGYKYPNPTDTSKPMECWILEVWTPPAYFGKPEEWPVEFLGPFPSRGMYTIKSPLIAYKNGIPDAVELDEGSLNAIRQKHFMDVQWTESGSKAQLEAIETQVASAEKARKEKADADADDLFDHYETHKHDLDQADKRVFSFPQHLETTRKNSKMPVR